MINLFKKKVTFVLLILAVLPILPLIHAGLPITHDGQDHVARIANFHQNLVEGNLIPRWAGNLNWGYGHPILEFLYPLPSYIASFFYSIGFSLADSTKIVFGIGMFSSLVFMYLWLSQFLSKYASVFGAVLYTYAPYRFVELYVRGDIGENLAFALVPLVLFFMYRVYKFNKFYDAAWGAISLAFLILAHNAISLMMVPFIFSYGLLLLYLSKSKLNVLMSLLFVGIMGFGLSAFFWVPGLLEGKYTLRDIVTKNGYINRFVSLGDLVFGKWNYGDFTVQYGIFPWIAIIFSPFVFIKNIKDKEKKVLIIFSILYVLLATFLMLSLSNFIWSNIMLLQNFQFPWRFLAIIVFSTSILGALLADSIPRKLTPAFVIFSILIVIIISSFYIKPKGYLHKPEDFYTGIYHSTTDTGESAPIWSIRFMEKTPRASLEVIDGKADINNLERKSTYHKYKVDVKEETIFQENTLYFPGWEIIVDGKPINIDFQLAYNNGIMRFGLDEGMHIVEVSYKETKLRLFADIISIVSALCVLGGLILLPIFRRRYKKYEK